MKPNEDLGEYMPVTDCPCICVQVDDLSMLDSIANNFPCSSTPNTGNNEEILDCVHIEEAEDLAQLKEILNVPDEVKLPVEGMIIFWCP